MITAQQATALGRESEQASAAQLREATLPILARIEDEIRQAASARPPRYHIDLPLSADEQPLGDLLVRELKKLGFEVTHAGARLAVSWRPPATVRHLNDKPPLPGQVLREGTLQRDATAQRAVRTASHPEQEE